MNLLSRIESALDFGRDIEKISASEWDATRTALRDALHVSEESGVDLYGQRIRNLVHDLDILSVDDGELNTSEVMHRVLRERQKIIEFIGLWLLPPNDDIVYDIRAAKKDDADAIADFAQRYSWSDVSPDDLSFQPVLGSYGDFYVAEDTADDILLGFIQIRDGLKSTAGKEIDLEDPSTFTSLTQIINIASSNGLTNGVVRRDLLQAALTRMAPIGTSEEISFSPPITDKDDHPQRMRLDEELRFHKFMSSQSGLLPTQTLRMRHWK